MDKNIINSQSEYDAVIEHAKGGKLVIISIWSDSSPICKATRPKIDRLATEYPQAEFYKMLLNAETQSMVKFGLQNMPVFILTKGDWATTVLGANMRMLEDAIKLKTS